MTPVIGIGNCSTTLDHLARKYYTSHYMKLLFSLIQVEFSLQSYSQSQPCAWMTHCNCNNYFSGDKDIGSSRLGLWNFTCGTFSICYPFTMNYRKLWRPHYHPNPSQSGGTGSRYCGVKFMSYVLDRSKLKASIFSLQTKTHYRELLKHIWTPWVLYVCIFFESINVASIHCLKKIRIVLHSVRREATGYLNPDTGASANCEFKYYFNLFLS